MASNQRGTVTDGDATDTRQSTPETSDDTSFRDRLPMSRRGIVGMLGLAGLGLWSGSAGAEKPGGGGSSGGSGGGGGKGNPHVLERIEELEDELADTRAELEATREAIGTFEFEEVDGELELQAFSPSPSFGDGIEAELVERIEDSTNDDLVAASSESAGSFTRGASLVDAVGGGVAGRLGEEAFPGDALIETIEKGLIVSMREEGFPGEALDLDAAFPDSLFIPGDAFVDVMEATLAERMTTAFPDSLFIPDSLFSPDNPYFPDSLFLPGETFINAAQTRGPLHEEVEGLSATLEPLTTEMNNLTAQLAGSDLGYEPIYGDIQFDPIVVEPILETG